MERSAGICDWQNQPIRPPAKSGGRKSQCEPFFGTIAAKVEVGLSAQRIYQDLVEQNGFTDSCESVKRFVRRLKERQPERIWRMECRPGEEVQVDFGLGAPIEDGRGKTLRSWVFRMVLSYSRKAYSEAVTTQDTETFLRCLENGVRSFGGVPHLLNLDNLKAAVLKANCFDPEINPKLADFCRHYGLHVMPCRPSKPQHKGKVERGVAYVRSNALKGRRFKSLAEENLFLGQWERVVADKRIHGTTRKQVAACFEEERPHLQPLPESLFPCYQEARRNVHRDSYVEVARAFYEVPAELIGQQVWVRWDSRCVRIFNQRMEQVQIHTRIEPGQFSRALGAGGSHAPVLSSCRYWISRAAVLGDECGQWAQAAFDAFSKAPMLNSCRRLLRMEENARRENSLFDRNERWFHFCFRGPLGRLAKSRYQRVVTKLRDHHRRTKRAGLPNTHPDACYSATGNSRRLAFRRVRERNLATVSCQRNERTTDLQTGK